VLTPLFLKLQMHDVLSDHEKQLLASAISGQRRVSIGDDLVSEGSRPTVSTLMVEGFAARYKLTADGGRQITAIHVAGDFVDLHAFLLKQLDHGIIALSPCVVTMAQHTALREISEHAPHLTRLLWLDTLVDGAIHRNWIVAMGRRSRASQLAHLICELYVRLKAVHRTDGASFHFPLSQVEMADVLGISAVHMNRVLQRFRKAGVISWVNQTVAIHDWSRLQEIADFDPTYLSFAREPR
jgi:CRP-like cAMP-binding protein